MEKIDCSYIKMLNEYIGKEIKEKDFSISNLFDNNNENYFYSIVAKVKELLTSNKTERGSHQNDIKGNNISHIPNSIDIELSGGKSYFVKYTVSYSTDKCGRFSSNTIFALTDQNGMVIPASKHIATVSDDVFNNNISLGIIFRPAYDSTIRLTNLTQDIDKIIVNAATITIFRLE